MNTKLKEAVRGFLPTRVRPHRIRRGPLRGHQIYTSWHDSPGAIRGNTEFPLLTWFERHAKSGQTWLDVGAHYGYTALALAELVGKQGRVLAFEPVLATAACVSRTRELNRANHLSVIPFGLASDPGIRPCRLPVIRGMADSTLAHGDWEELILVSSLDWLWESLCDGDPTIHGVKIDVQGMEGTVLQGMANILRLQRPKLVVEFHSGVDREVILRFLASCGYQTAAEPIEAGSEGALEDNKSYAFYPSN